MAKSGVTEAYLDNIFSVYIRLKNADSNGNVSCITCGRVMPWTEATNGHFVKRRHRSLRWDERNCHPQCATCNGADDYERYRRFIVNKYGEARIDELQHAKNTTVKMSPRIRQEMAAKYRNLIKQLKKP